MVRKNCSETNLNPGTQAVEAGAVAVIAAYTPEDITIDVPMVVIEDTADAASRLAVAFYNDPSSKMTVIGVAGECSSLAAWH